MTARTPSRRLMAGFLLAIAALASATRGMSGELVETALTLSLDAPAPRLAPLPAVRPAVVTVATAVTDSQRVEKTRARLLEEFRRAAETGLVTLRPDADGAFGQAGDQAPAPDRGPEPEPVEPPWSASDDVHPAARGVNHARSDFETSRA